MNEEDKIIVRLFGGSIQTGKIEARSLGRFLLNFQVIIDALSPKKAVTKGFLKDSNKLYLSDISGGSVRLTFEPGAQKTLYEQNVLGETYSQWIGISKALSKDPVQARDTILERGLPPSELLKFEFSIQDLMSFDFQVSFYTHDGDEIQLDRKIAPYLERWIEDDSKIGNKTLKGVLLRIKGDGPSPYFSMRTNEGSIVKCYYELGNESNIIDLFKKPLSVIGIADRGVKLSNVREILEIKPWKTELFSKVGHLNLNKTLEFEISYEDDIICLTNNEIRVTACAYDYKEAMKRLESNILEVYELYTHAIPNEELSESAKMLVKKLNEYIGEENYGDAKEKRDKTSLD